MLLKMFYVTKRLYDKLNVKVCIFIVIIIIISGDFSIDIHV